MASDVAVSRMRLKPGIASAIAPTIASGSVTPRRASVCIRASIDEARRICSSVGGMAELL
jgi:hypothetical protein